VQTPLPRYAAARTMGRNRRLFLLRFFEGRHAHVNRLGTRAH
jgi:hypothetical protein